MKWIVKIILICVLILLWLQVNDVLLNSLNRPWFPGQAMLSIFGIVVAALATAYASARIVFFHKGEEQKCTPEMNEETPQSRSQSKP